MAYNLQGVMESLAEECMWEEGTQTTFCSESPTLSSLHGDYDVVFHKRQFGDEIMERTSRGTLTITEMDAEDGTFHISIKIDPATITEEMNEEVKKNFEELHESLHGKLVLNSSKTEERDVTYLN